MTVLALPDDWCLANLTDLGETETSFLWRATSDQFGEVVVKRLKPCGRDERHGFVWQVWRDGQGSAKIFARTQDTVMMEFLPGPSLGEMARSGDDVGAARVLSAVARTRATMPSKPSPALPSLKDYLGDLFAVALEGLPKAARPAVQRGRSLAHTLLRSTTDTRALHGDLHHDNILHSSRGWLAIDPKGVSGDPAFELANAFRNPERAFDVACDPVRAINLARLFHEETGHAPDRLLDWALVLCATSAVWNRTAPERISLDITLFDALSQARASLPEPQNVL